MEQEDPKSQGHEHDIEHWVQHLNSLEIPRGSLLLAQVELPRAALPTARGVVVAPPSLAGLHAAPLSCLTFRYELTIACRSWDVDPLGWCTWPKYSPLAAA